MALTTFLKKEKQDDHFCQGFLIKVASVLVTVQCNDIFCTTVSL